MFDSFFVSCYFTSSLVLFFPSTLYLSSSLLGVTVIYDLSKYQSLALALSLSLSLSAQILKYKHNYWSKNFTATAKLQILMQLFMCFIVCHEEKVVNFYEINRHLIGKSQFIM